MNEIEEILKSLEIVISNDFINNLKLRLKSFLIYDDLFNRLNKIDNYIKENHTLNYDIKMMCEIELASILLEILFLEKEKVLFKSTKQHNIYIKTKNEFNIISKAINQRTQNNLEELEYELDKKRQLLNKLESSYIFSEYKDLNCSYENIRIKINSIITLLKINQIKLGDIEEILSITKHKITIETSKYSENLYKMSQPSINRIIQSNESIINIEDENSELVRYFVDNGKSEKAKLYSAYDELLEDYLDDETIDIIHWNCGQALSSSILLDYIREKDIELSISNIILIESSIKALSRGLLHIDVLKDEEYVIKTINKNIDDLNDSDLLIENSNINLHIFSNSFNMNHFDIDTLCNKFDNYQGINYFILISPNKNINLDRFYNYFDDNYDVELISKRDKNIGDYTRYEIIFKVEI